MRRFAETIPRRALALCFAVAACAAEWAAPSAFGDGAQDDRNTTHRVAEQHEPSQHVTDRRRGEHPNLAHRILAQRVSSPEVPQEGDQAAAGEGRAMRDAAIIGAPPADAEPRSANFAIRDADSPREESSGSDGTSSGRREFRAISLDAPDAAHGDEIPLAPPSGSRQTAPGSASPVTPTKALTTVLASLGVVLGLFLLVVWFMRRALPKAVAGLPTEVIEVLGRAPLANRQQMSLVRVGHKLVLLSVTQHGAESLTEITDPDEVNRLCGICREGQPGSISATFRQVLSQMSTESRWEEGGDRRGAERRESTERGAVPSLSRQAQRR